jgi:hypothetical protein
MPIWSCEEAHIMDLVHPVEDGGSQSSTLYARRRRKRKRSSKSVFERYTQFERLIRTGTTEENKSAFQYKKTTRRIDEEDHTHMTSKVLGRII